MIWRYGTLNYLQRLYRRIDWRPETREQGRPNRMTYCMGLKIADGLVFLSDTLAQCRR